MAAYKGLLKEKEALQTALTTPTQATEASTSAKQDITTQSASTASASTTTTTISINNKPSSTRDDHASVDLNKQIATLMNSLATLSAEKSRMEASFQADKRQMRQELQARDQHVRDLNDKIKAASNANTLEVEKVKSKLIIERHARDKEITDHMAMVKELQKLLSDERHLKDNLEMQLNDLKQQFTQTDTTDARVAELRTELEQSRRKYKELKNSTRANATANSQTAGQPAAEAATGALLLQVQADMDALKRQTMQTVSQEQRRAQQAEERSKRLAAVHEERVVTLEARLAELSGTVGSYDRLRQSDQEQIFRLKEQIAQQETISASDATNANNNGTHGTLRPATTQSTVRDIGDLIDEVYQLKKLLILENARQSDPRDLSKLFASADDHRDCTDAYDRLHADFERCRSAAEPLHGTVETQKQHMRTLQDKIQVLNRNIDEQEQELKHKSTAHYAELKTERAKWKELVASMEMDFRGKVSDLEVQLQKQRERSLKLLEEKELEIKQLKQSIDTMLQSADSVPGANGCNATAAELATVRRKISNNNGADASTANGSAAATAECHMLHYVHELSRKEVEIAALRKAKNIAEASLRQALQDKVTSQQELHDRIGDLEYNVDRLERCKSRESANLEYLKNVVLSFLMADDADSRRHMINAIGAVLQFSPAELKTIGGSVGVVATGVRK